LEVYVIDDFILVGRFYSANDLMFGI